MQILDSLYPKVDSQVQCIYSVHKQTRMLVKNPEQQLQRSAGLRQGCSDQNTARGTVTGKENHT